MRIESLSPSRYFLQAIKEDPLELKPYSYLLALIPLLMICSFFDWNSQLLLFILFGYFCALVGFLAAYKSRKKSSLSLKKHAYQSMSLDHLKEMVVLQNNRNHKVTYANTAFYETLGFDPKQHSDIRFEDFIKTEKHLPFFKKRKSDTLSISTIEDKEVLLQMRKQDGALIWMEQASKSIIENGAFTLYSFQDVTDKILLKQATEQFAKDLMQRKAKMGKLASVVALRVS